MDDDFDFGGYNPSINVNSRSGSMKKLVRKTDQSPKPVQNKNASKNNDFDELDDLLNNDIKPKKKDTSLAKNQSSSLPKKGSDTLDSFFDQPSTNLNLTSKIQQKKETKSPTVTTNNMDMARTSINWKMDKSLDKKSDFDIIDEDNLMPSFSRAPRQRPTSPTTNQIKLPEDNSFGLESHTSMRNMRPPLKRKDSAAGLGEKTSNNLGLGLSLADEKKDAFANASHNHGLSLIEEPFQPSRSMNVTRRGSIDNKSERKFDGNLTLIGVQSTMTKKQINVSQFNIPDRSNQTTTLKIDSPKHKKNEISEMKIGESIMINEKLSNFYNPKHENISILKHESFKPTDTNTHLPNSSSYSFQKPHARLVEPPKLSPSPPISEQQSRHIGSYNYQKQLEQIKQTYQKQLSYLQESLDKQINIGQETRQRLMREANNMIEQERRRQSRIHQEQVKRIKEINEWEKKKMEDSYKFEIDNLKAAISQYQAASKEKPNSNQSYSDSANKNYKRQIEQLTDQLQLQKKLLLDRQNHLNKRQLQLEEKLQELTSRRSRQDEYFREQEKNLLEKENKLRNGILNEKKDFMEEKQRLAMEAANLQLDVMKRKQKLDLMIKQQEMERQALQNQRYEVRALNQQMMARFKQKMNELQMDKERVANIEAEMIRKLRIIELKAKQSNIPLHNTHQNNQAKENNWVRPQSAAGQKHQRLNETFQRYNKVQKMANQKSAVIQMLNKTTENPPGHAFRLQDYLIAMNKNNKSRHNNFI